MIRSLARPLTFAFASSIAVLMLGFALSSSAKAASPGWLAVSGSTGYRASSTSSREPVIFSRSLDSGREERLGVAPGFVFSGGSAANGSSVALTVGGTTEVTLILFRRGQRSIKLDVAKDTECNYEGPAPAEFAFAPLNLAADGTLTYLKKNASTGCQFWIVRRDPSGRVSRVWTPPTADLLSEYSTIEVKGKLVLLGKASGIEPGQTFVYNSVSKRIVYSVPQRFTPYYRVHLATSGTLGLSYIVGKRSWAFRVNLRTQREEGFEFPHGTEALFCGRFTVFAGAHLVKVFDELGRTVFRQPTRDFSILGYPAICSSKDGKSAALLLSLTKFKLRKLG